MGRPGLVGTVARTAVVAGTATAVSRGVWNKMSAKDQPPPLSNGEPLPVNRLRRNRPLLRRPPSLPRARRTSSRNSRSWPSSIRLAS